MLPRPLRTVLRITVDQDGGVHRPRGRSRDAIDLEPGLLKQAIEHAPRKGAMSAAALQCQVHKDRCPAAGLPLTGCRHRDLIGLRQTMLAKCYNRSLANPRPERCQYHAISPWGRSKYARHRPS